MSIENINIEGKDNLEVINHRGNAKKSCTKFCCKNWPLNEVIRNILFDSYNNYPDNLTLPW